VDGLVLRCKVSRFGNEVEWKKNIKISGFKYRRRETRRFCDNNCRLHM